MVCQKCGTENAENSVYCVYCGNKLEHTTNTGNTVNTGYVEHTGYVEQNQPVYQDPVNYQNYPELDREDTLLNVLSFMFPLIGLILYFVDRNQKPKQAHGEGEWALISIGIRAGIALIFSLTIFFSFFNVFFSLLS